MDTTTATADAIASSESSNGNCDLENENITEVDEIEICIMKSKNKKLIVTEDEDSEVKVEVKVESDVHHTMNSDDEVVIMPHMSNGDIKIEDEHCGHDDNVMVLITNGPTTTLVITDEVDDGEDSSSDSSMISVICCDDSVNNNSSDDSEDGSESDLLGLGIEEDGDSTPRVSVVEDPLMLLNLKTTSNSKSTSSSDDVSDVVSDDVVEMFVPEHSNHKLVTNRSGRTKMVTFSTVASSSPTSPTKSPETMTNNLSKTHTTSSIVTCFANGSNNNNNKDNKKEINNNSNKQICRSTSSSELGPVPLSSIGNISNLEPEPEVKENGTTSVTSTSTSGSTTFTVTNAVIDSSGPHSESANISDSQTTSGSLLPPTPSSGANESNLVFTSTELTTSSTTTSSSSSTSYSESQLPSPSQIMMSLSSTNTGTLVPSKNSSKLCPTIALASPSPTSSSSSKGSYHNHVHNSHKHHTGDNGGTVATSSHYSDIMSGGSTPTPSSHPHLTLEVPYAILTNKDNSCPFFERRIALLTPAKVGRAIARVRPSPDNAIFDCKVLSRNHALLMYQDGKFFLKDTHSSNGTFVNDYRLSSANEMSQPHELFSGDCVKFGVEVIEKKQVYSCIIATIQLFLPDGTEAKPLGPHSHHHHHHLMSSDYRLDEYHHQKGGMNGGGGGPGGVGQSGTYLNANVSITPSQLVELSFFIKDAIHKQCLLESQFDSMKEVMKDSMESAKHSWESLVEEDQLLNRIETLQAKLETLLLSTNKDGTEDAKLDVLQQEMLHLIEDKEKMEQSSKFAVQKAIESKTVTSSKLQASELELRAKELECQNLNTIIADNLKEMNNLVSNCDNARKEIEELVAKLRASKEEQLKLCLLFDRERAELQEKIVILEHHEIEMRFKEQQRQSLANPPDSNIYSLILCEASCQTELDGVKEEDNKLSIQQPQISSHKDQEEFSLLKEKYQKQSAQLEFYQTQSVGLNLLMENVQSQLQQLKHSTVSNAILVHTLLNEKETTLRTVIEKFKLLTEMQHTKLRTKEVKLNELCERVVPELEEDNRKLTEKSCGFGETIDKLNQEIDRLRSELDKGRSEDSKTSLNHTESDGIIDFRLPPTTNCLTEVLDSAAAVDITIGCHRRESKQTQTTVVDSAIRSEHKNNNVQTNNMLRIILDKIDPHSLANCDVVGGGQSDGDLREELRLVSVNNDTTVHKTTDNAQSSQIQKQLIDKIDQVCVKNREIRQQNEQLAEEIHTLRENYDSLHFRNELYSSMAIIPLLVIFVSIIAALNPILSRLTGTNEK